MWNTTLLVSGFLASLTSANAKSVTMTVVVRDHLAGRSSEIQVPGKLWDSTAGSWVGDSSAEWDPGASRRIPGGEPGWIEDLPSSA
jgi:hypothetical protein